MRTRADADRVRRFLRALGDVAREPSTIYLAGGASAVLEGWRPSTLDVYIRLEPDRDELMREIPRLKEALDLNVELASPLDFLPEPPGWRDRSPFIVQEGQLTVRHLDFRAQALAKLERGFDQDQADVRAMLERGLVTAPELREAFEAIEDRLYRFPAVDPGTLRSAVDRVTGG
jgi:hypothetical protein